MNIHFKTTCPTFKLKTGLIITGVIIMTLTGFFNTAPSYSTTDMTQRIQHSPQFEKDRFGAGQEPFSMNWKTHADLLWRFITENNQRTPSAPLPGKPFKKPEAVKKRTPHLSSAWFGHSTILININGYHVLTDPVFEEKVSLVGPVRFKQDTAVNVSSLPEIDVVIISHDHYDHLNKKSIKILNSITQKFAVPLGVGKYLLRWGIPADKIIQLDWWESYTHDQGLSITATPSQHFSGRGLTDRNKTLWASFVIKSETRTVFFSGDSGYTEKFKEIGNTFGPFDMTFLECGAYDLAWHPVHMLPEETVMAHLDLKGKVLHPIHWGTFNLAFHPWYEPMQRLLKASKGQGVSIATPAAGEVIEPEKNKLGSHWWQDRVKKAKNEKTMALAEE